MVQVNPAVLDPFLAAEMTLITTMDNLLGGRPGSCKALAGVPSMIRAAAVCCRYLPSGCLPAQTHAILSAGAAPQRIVCSGHAGGGAWAQLAGVWAFSMYPDANVRVISFGAPLCVSLRDAELSTAIGAVDASAQLHKALLCLLTSKVIRDHRTKGGGTPPSRSATHTVAVAS